MVTYIMGTQKNHLNETFLLSTKNGSVGQHFFQNSAFRTIGLIYFAQAVRIFYAEDRAQMNRELNSLFYGK